MSFATVAAAYLLGGVTFLPLVLVAFVYLHPKKKHSSVAPPFLAGQVEEDAQTGLDCFKQGWIFVTHEDLESQDEISAKTESVAESHDVKSAYSSLYKLVTNSNKGGAAANAADLAAASGEAPGTGQGSAAAPAAAPAAVPAAVAAVPAARPASAASKKHRYYAVLKHGNLFLYKNERLQDVKHVIVLASHVVSLWPRSLSDASLFTKYSSIAILKNDWARPRRLSDNFAGGGWGHGDKIGVRDVLRRDSGLPAPPGSIFVYTDLNIDKEDWYFALLRATKSDAPAPAGLSPAVYARTLHLETPSMVALIRRLYSSEGQVQSKWFNAVVGRVFLSLQKTDLLKSYLTAKIERKLNKIKTPGFLDKFSITSVDAGSAAPTVTFPVLKEISPQGDLLVSMNVHYAGGMSMQLATKANINLGSRFKTREVDVVLSVTLETISGPMLVRVKAPPSARVWYTYEREPDVSIKIEPVISSRQMSYNIITNSIEKKFKDAIRDSLVLPHWDDLVFCPTPDELYRGGIWEKDPQAEERDQKAAETSAPDTASDSLSTDAASAVTVSSDEQRPDPSALSDAPPARSQKAKVSKTISDLSKRLRKPKSGHTLGVDDTHCLSDGSVVEASRRSPAWTSAIESPTASPPNDDSSQNVSTFRKLGEWYSKGDKASSSKPYAASSPTLDSTYHPPEMISNRRTRKQSSATVNSDVEKATDGSSYDFGKELNENFIPQPIDLIGSASVKAGAPQLPPREFKAAAISEPVEMLSEVAPATLGGLLDTKQSTSHSTMEEDVLTDDKVSHDSQFSGCVLTTPSSSQRPISRTTTTVGRKPPPDIGDDHEITSGSSTAPL